MKHMNSLVAAVALAVGLTMPSTVSAQARSRGGGQGAPSHGVAVPRGSVRGPGGAVRPGGVPYRPYYYYPGYRSGLGFGLGFYYGYGYPYYGYPYPYYYGYPYPVYGYPPYGYPYPGYGAVGVGAYGGVRLEIPQRDAEVYVDGYFAGIVDQFDGTFQHLNLEAGPHHIEVRAQGFEAVAFDVNVQPGQTITYRASLRPAQP